MLQEQYSSSFLIRESIKNLKRIDLTSNKCDLLRRGCSSRSFGANQLEWVKDASHPGLAFVFDMKLMNIVQGSFWKWILYTFIIN